MKEQKCPQCGFSLTNNSYCVRCGYVKKVTITDMEKYKETKKDIELYLKEDYLKILHGENTILIFILGLFYLSYLNYPILGVILEGIELVILYFLFQIHIYLWDGGIVPLILIILNFLLFRLIEASFLNPMILKLAERKLKKLKAEKNYQQILYQHQGHSLFSLIFSFFLFFLLIAIWVIIYRLIRGNY